MRFLELTITDHALKRFRQRLSDPEATELDIGRLVLESKEIVRKPSAGKDGGPKLLTRLEDVVFVMEPQGEGVFRLITVLTRCTAWGIRYARDQAKIEDKLFQEETSQ